MKAKISRGFVVLLVSVFFCSAALSASPRVNYLLYCSGCHRVNGEGKHPNVPTLRGELGRMLSETMMRSYLVRIPGASQAPINDAELAAVINWVLDEFNAQTLPSEFEKYTSREVSEARSNVLADPLSYRTEHWKPYSD